MPRMDVLKANAAQTKSDAEINSAEEIKILEEMKSRPR